MTDKDFISNFMINNIFLHNKYGRVKISSIPNANGDVDAFAIDIIKPIRINIKDIKSEYQFGYMDENNTKNLFNK